MAEMKFYADCEYAVTQQVREAFERQAEQNGEDWNSRKFKRIRPGVYKFLAMIYAEKLREMILEMIEKKHPEITPACTVAAKMEPSSFEPLEIIVTSPEWEEELTPAGWKEIEHELYIFLHEKTVWVEGCRPWKEFQRATMQKILKHISEGKITWGGI